VTNQPDNLNDYAAWLALGNIKEAMDALVNRVTGIVGNEQTAQMLVKKLSTEQAARDEQLGHRLEQAMHGLKTSLNNSIGDFQERTDARLTAYGAEIDRQRDQISRLDRLAALLEESAGFFTETVLRVGALEYGYAKLADRLDLAVDPKRPGATIEMRALQDRVTLLTRLVLATLGLSLFLLILLAIHTRQMADLLPSVTGG
jgi:hypothetical protein